MTSEKIKLTDIISPNFYDLHEKLKAQKYTEIWCRGGRGSTKSSTISAEIILGMFSDNEAHAIIFRRYENEIRDSVWNQLKWTVNKTNTGHLWHFIASPFLATYKPTGQMILFRAADKPFKLKSIKLPFGYIKYAWFEEVDQYGSMDEVRNLEQSLFRGTDQYQIAFYSYNPPKSSRSWANAETKIEKRGRVIHYSDYRGVPRDWIGERFIVEAEHLKKVNETAYRHEYLGEEVGTGLEIFNNITIRKIDDEEIKIFDKIYQGLDFGYAVDPLAFNRMHYDAKKRKLFIFYEIHGIGISNREFAQKLPNDMKLFGTIADSSEPKSIDELRRDYGMKIIGAKKGPGSVEYGIKWLSDLEEIVIDPNRCPLAAKEFVNYALDIRRDGEIISKYPDKDNHTIDDVRYALENVSRKQMTVSKFELEGI